MRCPPFDGRLGPAPVVALFALVNLPALLLACWLGANLYAQHATGDAIELSEATAGVILTGLACGLAGNLMLYRGVNAAAGRLEAALDECSAQKARAEAVRAAKDRFLASMNHDLRTPLNGVLGLAQVLSQADLSPEQAAQVAMLRRSAEELVGLLEGRLKSCEGSGELPAAPQPRAALLLSADEADRQRLGGLLADAGCSVVAVADGQSGMTELVRGVVEGSPFTLIVMTDEWTEADEEWLRQVEQSPARCPAIVLPRQSGMRELRAALARA
jgi:signal transduction histidine kinase